MLSLKVRSDKCPVCQEPGTLRNSRPRKYSEKLARRISWFELYRCKKCGWRGYQSNFQITVKELNKYLMYLLMMLVSALIVIQILKKIS